MTSATEFIDELDTIRNEAMDNGLLVTDNQTIELLPCWSCGGKADIAEMTTKCDGMTFFKALCNDCFCPGANIHMWYKTKSEAIAAWNTRAMLESDPYDAVSCEHVISPDTLHLILDEGDAHPGGTATNENMAQLFSHTVATSSCRKLTAEQVREVLLYHLPHREYYNIEQTDAWQTIANELNAIFGNDEVTEDSIDKWLREFQLAHGELTHIGPDELKDLACALHDDIPLGYEASMRLGQWLLHAIPESGKLTAEQVRGFLERHSIFGDATWLHGTAELVFDENELQIMADELNGIFGSDEEEVDVDKIYAEKIKPRLIKGTPTEDIRRGSILAHSVMEITGPSTFGADGNVVLWLHEKSLTQLLDMCDIVDEKFSMGHQTSALTAE